MNQPDPNDELFSRVCDGLASKEEIGSLHQLIRHDTAVMDAWLRYSALHQELAGGEALALAEPAPVLRSERVSGRQWRPLASAAAGLVFGMFSATLVWAYVAPHDGRTISLLDESFETTSAPLATHMPLEPGVWRGNNAEITEAQPNVKPEHGRKMLRFLRSDFDGKSKASGGHISDVYRLIDVREFHREFDDGGAVVQASASVNANAFPDDERYGCAITIYALDADSVPESASYLGTALASEANAMARSIRAVLDRDPSNWQRLTTEMRLPANTGFLVVRLHINQLFEPNGRPIFTGSYADDVHVTLTRRSPLP